MQEFNKGVYDYIIATDEGTSRGEVDSDQEDDAEDKKTAEPEECESLQIFSWFI